jgi:hypothetical protein
LAGLCETNYDFLLDEGGALDYFSLSSGGPKNPLDIIAGSIVVTGVYCYLLSPPRLACPPPAELLFALWIEMLFES